MWIPSHVSLLLTTASTYIMWQQCHSNVLHLSFKLCNKLPDILFTVAKNIKTFSCITDFMCQLIVRQFASSDTQHHTSAFRSPPTSVCVVERRQLRLSQQYAYCHSLYYWGNCVYFYMYLLWGRAWQRGKCRHVVMKYRIPSVNYFHKMCYRYT
jgi:hypothetical protein